MKFTGKVSEESVWKGSRNENWNYTCFTNRKKIESCQKLKIMNKWAFDDDRHNLRENGSESLVVKALTFWLKSLVSGTVALELLQNLF